MNKLTRISATVASSLALVAGFSGVANASSYDNGDNGDRGGRGGHHRQMSQDRLEYRSSVDVDVDVANETDVVVDNSVDQFAETGDVVVADNGEEVGSVWSGDAVNDSLVDSYVEVENHTDATGAMEAAHPANQETWMPENEDYDRVDYRADVDVDADVVNDTDVVVENDVIQTAVSGDVTVVDNDEEVGDVRSGDATNVSTIYNTIVVKNNTSL